jgi:hypothetical protein
LLVDAAHAEPLTAGILPAQGGKQWGDIRVLAAAGRTFQEQSAPHAILNSLLIPAGVKSPSCAVDPRWFLSGAYTWSIPVLVIPASGWSSETKTGAIAAGSGYYGALKAVPAIPEPESMAMLSAGLGLLGFIAWRRSRAFAPA